MGVPWASVRGPVKIQDQLLTMGLMAQGMEEGILVLELVCDKNEASSAPLQEGHRDLRPHPRLPWTTCVPLGRLLAFSVLLFFSIRRILSGVPGSFDCQLDTTKITREGNFS